MCSSGFLNRYVNYFPDYRRKAMGVDIYNQYHVCVFACLTIILDKLKDRAVMNCSGGSKTYVRRTDKHTHKHTER